MDCSNQHLEFRYIGQYNKGNIALWIFFGIYSKLAHNLGTVLKVFCERVLSSTKTDIKCSQLCDIKILFVLKVSKKVNILTLS